VRVVQVLVRAVLGVAIVAVGVSGAVLPAYADSADLPSAPVHVMVSNATLTTLEVSWTEPVPNGGAAISDYTIEYRKVGELSWTTVTHTASAATSITVTGLDSDSVYQFRVAAVNSVGTGPWSVQETTIAAGGAHSCALMADGTAQCWGDNGDGQLSDNSEDTNSLVPVSVSGITGLTPATTAVGVSTGGAHSCSLMADGTAQCWGANGDGQLGDNSTTNRSVPVSVSGLTGLTAATTAVSVSAGSSHSCAVMADGTAQCWGANYNGQLGDNTTTNSPVPVSVSGITGLTPATTAVGVSTGGYHSCAVMEDGTAQCWGDNVFGQLGNNSTTNSPVPVSVSGITGLTPATTAVSVSTGNYHSCAVMADGTATCWGYNSDGQLGDNSTTNSPVPVSVSGITGLTPATTAVSVSTGGSTSCALMADGTAKCWGYNGDGQLGDNSTTDSPVPVSVSGITGLAPATTAISVSAGNYHSCALMADGTATCWGYNGKGRLGNNSTTNSPVPVPVSGITGLTAATSSLPVSSFGRTLVPLSRPVRLVVTDRNADSIAIRWGVPADNGGKHIDLYRVNYRPKGSSSWTAFAIVPYSQLHLRVQGLRAGVTYEFQVRAHNADGLGDASRVMSATVPVRAPAPIVVKKLWDKRVIRLTWRAVQTPAHSPITGYVMSCQDRDGETFRKEVGRAALSASLRVPAAQLYSCRVAAVTDAGRGEGSEWVQISTRIRD
jgi:alpha-tubulin suppressor-like RCC1 family protein